MRKILILAAAVLLLMGTAACGENAPDYYGAGIEVTKLMGEVAGNGDYLALLTSNQEIAAVGEAISTNDYDRPAAVYSLKMKDENVFLNLLLKEDEGGKREKYRNLPEELQKQLMNRLNVQAYCVAMINGRAGGTERLAFSSAATVYVENEGIASDEGLYYLYTFEKGTPILVSFGYHAAGGMFMFLTEEQTATAEALSNALPDLEITPVGQP